MPPERRIRLTFPVCDFGGARIIADGKHEVGRVLAGGRGLAGGYGWRAWLWPEADLRPGRADLHSVETVRRPTLREVRAVLRERVVEKGPWWK
jgi:hypothetical protein